MDKTTTWKDKSDHPRCSNCGSRVRTRPRSSRLKTLLRQQLKYQEELKVNQAKTAVEGQKVILATCPS